MARTPAALLVVALASLVAAAAPARAAIDENDTTLLTGMVTASLSKVPQLDVIAAEDVRRQMELEATRQSVGCASSTSCIAEMAGALGARFAIYGQAGELDGGDVVLTLNLFDSDNTSAAGRVAVQAKSVSALANQVDKATQDLVAQFVAGQPADAPRARVLVLDIAAPKHVAADEERVAEIVRLQAEVSEAKKDYWPYTPVLLGGLGLGIGGVVFGVGYGLDQLFAGADDHWTIVGCGIGAGATVVLLGAAAGITTVTNHFIAEDIDKKQRALDDFKAGGKTTDRDAE